MIVLENLPGVKKKKTKAFFISSAKEVSQITAKRAVTAAYDNGAINIWLDDAGNYRCEAMRYCVSINQKIYDDISQVQKWAKKWLKRIS